MTSTFNQVLGIKPCEVFRDMSTVKIFREIHDHHEGTNAGQGHLCEEPDSVPTDIDDVYYLSILL